MKKLVLALGLSMMSSMAFADQRIDLAAGSRVRLNVGQSTIVTCEGQSSNGSGANSKCSVKKNSFGWTDVYNGENIISSNSNLEDALKVVKQMRDAGLCN